MIGLQFVRRSVAVGVAATALGAALVVEEAHAATRPASKTTLAQVGGQAGTLDQTFNSPKGFLTTTVGQSASANAVAVGPAGKIVAAGDGGMDEGALVRYLRDGSIDATFGQRGRVRLGTPNDIFTFSGVSVQSDGRIVATGSSNTGVLVARFRRNGTLDRSFGFPFGYVIQPIRTGAVANGQIVQPDGKIVVVGSTVITEPAPLPLTEPSTTLVQPLPLLDATMIEALTKPDPPQLATLTDVTESAIFVARFNTNGSLDTTFGEGGLGYTITTAGSGFAFGQAIAQQANGRIVVTGGVQPGFEQEPSKMVVARFTPDGLLDSSFATPNGFATLQVGENASGQSITVQRNGRILAAGTGNANDQQGWLVARYLQSGAIDSSFGAPNGFVTLPLDQAAGGDGTIEAIAEQPNGRIVLGGFNGPAPAVSVFYIGRLLRNGTLDRTSFARPNGFDSTTIGSFSEANGLALTPRGDAILAGEANVGGVFQVAVAKYLGRNRPSQPRP